ncbi:MAG: L-serine ammonia-lyase, iron-sulfur-dependent, subunit alpha [Oscillospiraceae bacterium]|nr:L-serine ammonia-lyase, iron-sulfur-dependent, subunit alpha [Oscillospiraceae bacterium]
MKSIREIYKIGKGPSSSHTMGPEKAAHFFRKEHPEADRIQVTLYGSLAKTGRGHGTDRVIVDTLAPIQTEILWNETEQDLPHPNTMDFAAFAGGICTGSLRVLSVGGGDIRIPGRPEEESPEVYEENSFAEIAEVCKRRRIRIPDYVEEHEGPEIWDFLFSVWNAMCDSIQAGLTCSGILPGGLNVERKAQMLYNQRHMDEQAPTRENRLVCAYAFAVSEQNASQGTVVTAPTCGSCGTLPAVLKYMQEDKRLSDQQILRALAVAGIIGNLVKTNASISGAECGCQAEIGTACSMAAAALAELFEMGIDQIEYAAEVALEHHLGLTCDPICGLVQIPCIERNAVAAMRAINALRIANFLTATRKISFDLVVETMYQTGHDLSRRYRETSEGGLARLYHPEAES